MENYTNERLLKMAALVAHAPSLSERMNMPKRRQPAQLPARPQGSKLDEVREILKRRKPLDFKRLNPFPAAKPAPTEDMLRPTMVERLGGPGNGQNFSAGAAQPSAAYAKQPYAGWEGRISPSAKASMQPAAAKPVPQASWEKRRQHAALSDSEIAADYKRRLGKLVGGVASGVGNMIVGNLGGTAGSVALMLRDMARK